jgi:hypothetical protein
MFAEPFFTNAVLRLLQCQATMTVVYPMGRTGDCKAATTAFCSSEVLWYAKKREQRCPIFLLEDDTLVPIAVSSVSV